jgi:hypothetical protein
MSNPIRDFGTDFSENKARGFILVNHNYNPVDVQAWSIAVRKYDNSNLALIVFGSSAEAEVELKLFPAHLQMRVEPIQHSKLCEYIKLMQDSVKYSVLVFCRNANGKFSKVPLNTSPPPTIAV